MPYKPTHHLLKWLIKPVLFLLCLLPFIYMMWLGVNQELGSNPVEELTHRTGDWCLRFLLITLLVTPLRQLTKMNWLISLRRMLGLYAFFYAFIHFITYIWLDQSLDFSEILKDIPKRPFITIGFVAFVLLIPLALTSTNGMIKRLGSNWRKLHRLVYVIPVLGIIHFIWLVKADILQPMIYATILGLLLGYRVWKYKIRKA